ncbi:MAG: hypothetical protein RDA78_13610 [Roseibium sp.]|uniref:hypothetical protein n=1 Tax=Roseibium sp. TaxID=1936156 RepID=UPI003D9C229B
MTDFAVCAQSQSAKCAVEQRQHLRRLSGTEDRLFLICREDINITVFENVSGFRAMIIAYRL